MLSRNAPPNRNCAPFPATGAALGYRRHAAPLSEEFRTQIDHVLWNRIKLPRIELHHVLVLYVVSLVDELLERWITGKTDGIQFRRDAEKLHFLVADIGFLELRL